MCAQGRDSDGDSTKVGWRLVAWSFEPDIVRQPITRVASVLGLRRIESGLVEVPGGCFG